MGENRKDGSKKYEQFLFCETSFKGNFFGHQSLKQMFYHPHQNGGSKRYVAKE